MRMLATMSEAILVDAWKRLWPFSTLRFHSLVAAASPRRVDNGSALSTACREPGL